MTGPEILALALSTFAALLSLLTWIRGEGFIEQHNARHRRTESFDAHLAPLPHDRTHTTQEGFYLP